MYGRSDFQIYICQPLASKTHYLCIKYIFQGHIKYMLWEHKMADIRIGRNSEWTYYTLEFNI